MVRIVLWKSEYKIFLKIFWKKFAKNLEIKKMFVPLHSEMVNADVAQLARAADL